MTSFQCFLCSLLQIKYQFSQAADLKKAAVKVMIFWLGDLRFIYMYCIYICKVSDMHVSLRLHQCVYCLTSHTFYGDKTQTLEIFISKTSTQALKSCSHLLEMTWKNTVSDVYLSHSGRIHSHIITHSHQIRSHQIKPHCSLRPVNTHSKHLHFCFTL